MVSKVTSGLSFSNAVHAAPPAQGFVASLARPGGKLESDGTEFGRSLAQIAANKRRTYDYLLRVSMIASLRRAQELG